MIAQRLPRALIEAILIPHDFDVILLCSGDAHYCEPIRKASIKGIRVYICAVGLDVSPDLASLAPFYPIERYLNTTLTRRVAEQQQLPGIPPKNIGHWVKLVRILDSLESTLPFVAVGYFHKQIMLSYLIGGQTDDDRWTWDWEDKIIDMIA